MRDPQLPAWGITFNEDGRHAEEIFLDDHLKPYLHYTSNNEPIDYILPGMLNGHTIDLKMNLSPCADCARRLCELAMGSPSLDLTIKIIKVYKHYDSKTEAYLRRLVRRDNVSLTVLTETVKEYGGLFERSVPVDIETQQKLDKLREPKGNPLKHGVLANMDSQVCERILPTKMHTKRNFENEF